jgi:hypothetical protein
VNYLKSQHGGLCWWRGIGVCNTKSPLVWYYYFENLCQTGDKISDKIYSVLWENNV